MPDKASPEEHAFNRAKADGEQAVKAAGFVSAPGGSYPCPAGFDGGAAWWRHLADNARAHTHNVRAAAALDARPDLAEERKHLEDVVSRHGFKLKG